jgi:hypothetical protein
MSQQLESAMRDIAKMPYYKNQAAQSGTYNPGHEAAVAEKLTAHGFKENLKSVLTEGFNGAIMKEWLEDNNLTKISEITANMAPGSYIVQPGGKHLFPDIMVKDFNSRMVAIECKSTEGKKPMWNDSLPRDEAIYVISSESYDATTVFMGRDAIDAGQRDMLYDYHKKLKALTDEFKKDLEDKFGKGWHYYPRPQYNCTLDPFEDEQLRSTREEAVFKYAGL